MIEYFEASAVGRTVKLAESSSHHAFTSAFFSLVCNLQSSRLFAAEMRNVSILLELRHAVTCPCVNEQQVRGEAFL